MTVVRRKISGGFTERELSLLGSAYRLLTPLIDRHRTLIGEVVENRADRIAELEERFGQRFPALTPREREIVVLVASGLGNDEIAAQLFVSPFTAKTHAVRAMTKVGARDRAQLVSFVFRAGLQP